jgi:hypothetical protein
MEAWAELFPYFTKDQIRHIIDKLKRKKILLVGVFNRTRYDRTLWYSVNDDVMGLYNSTIRPQGQMEAGNIPVPSASKGKCKWEKSPIEVENIPDRSGQIPGPIPYIKPDIKQADAACGESSKNQEAAATEINKLKTALDTIDSLLLFDVSFYPKAIRYLSGEKLDEAYLAWVHTECLKRKPDNLRGLYYKLFFQSDILALFREYEKKIELAKPVPVICAVCGFSYKQNLCQCPNCNFSPTDSHNAELVTRHRNYFNLPPEKKEAYEAEQRDLLSLLARNPSDHVLLREKWAEIEKKYHILE